MRARLSIVVGLLALVSAPAVGGQITDDPIPAPVQKRGLAVEIRDVVRLPDTRGLRPLDQDVSPAGWARPNYVRDLPDGRRFVNDSRGRLYQIGANNQVSIYADVAAAFPNAVYNRLVSGFSGFTFRRLGGFYCFVSCFTCFDSFASACEPGKVQYFCCNRTPG